MWRIILCLKNKKQYLALLFVLSLLYCCGNADVKKEEGKAKKVVEIGEVVLYEDEVLAIVEKQAGTDSVALRDRYVNNWIRKELLLQKAKMNLSESEQDVEERVKDYKESLLINQYKQKYLTENLDTLVTEEEISLYIEEYSSSFILEEPIYKYYIAKVLSKNTGDMATVTALFNKKDVNLMQDFKLQNSTVISSYDTDWYSVSDILKHFPEEVSKEDLKKMKAGKIFVVKDDTYTYILRPLEKVKEGEISPLEYVQDKVKEIILHNRKIALAKQLEYEIYEDAKNKNQFKIH